MENTAVVLSEQQKKLVPTPYRKDNREVATTTSIMGMATPASAVYSNVADLSKLAVAQLKANEMNSLGYELLGAGKTKEAITIFKLNVAAFPKLANAYDSLGEAYLKDGNTELAIKNYEKAFVLDPKNTNAAAIVKKLKSK